MSSVTASDPRKPFVVAEMKTHRNLTNPRLS
jgi:hypothetical protein